MKWVLFILAAALLGCAAPVAYELTLLLHETRVDEDKITGEVEGWNHGVWNTLGNTSSAMNTIAQVAGHESKAFKQQNEYYIDLGKQTKTVLESANVAITRFGKQTLPAAGLLLTNGSDLVSHVDASTSDVFAQFHGLLTAAQTATEAITVDAQSANATLEPLAGAATNVEATTANLQATTKDVETWVHTETAPIKGAWHAIKSVLFELLGPMAEVVSAIK